MENGNQLNPIKRLIRYSFIILMACISATANALEVDLTRHLSELERTFGHANVHKDKFFGVEGTGTLIVSSDNPSDHYFWGNHCWGKRPSVYLNGKRVVSPKKFRKNDCYLEIPVQLKADNKIKVKLRGWPGNKLQVRVKQLADVDLNITGRIHFQVNASDFEVSQAFYENFGFGSWLPFPSTNTLEVAQAVGLDHPYDIRVEVGLMLPSPDGGLFGFPAIDLIQWNHPARLDPPYAQINHLGMARVALRTTNLDADIEYLQSKGVDFLTMPAVDGTRFAIFTDPDGVYYELVEADGPPPTFPNATSISGVAHVNVNVSDFERSRAFYKMLGYADSVGPAYIDTPEVAALLGLSEPVEVEGELIGLAGNNASVIEMLEWQNPGDSERAYPPPINHIGINRLAYFTLDLEGDVAKLKAQGVEFLSEIAPCCEGPASTSGIVAFYDPDGTFIELLGAITPPSP